ncbi:MAG TPA: nucleotide pyrophosphohydrolase [Bacilli bacterium]|nr:nucleotide pyrophosphohydrolase [Bacilli bacterium]
MDGTDLTLNQVQAEVDAWASQFTTPYFAPLSRMAAMTEEVGEVARVINNMYGDKKKKDEENEKNLVEELGDLLFTLICMANAEGINLNEAFAQKMNKVTNRDSNRWEKHK